jgi:hypothetical protein
VDEIGVTLRHPSIGNENLERAGLGRTCCALIATPEVDAIDARKAVARWPGEGALALEKQLEVRASRCSAAGSLLVLRERVEDRRHS